MYCLTRNTFRCNSVVQKICMLLQKETSHCKNSLALVPQGPEHYIFRDLSFYLKWTEFRRNLEFFSSYGPWRPELNWNKFTISDEFGPLQVKWWYHMFSSIKIEEYMESEPSAIFWVKLVAKNIVLGPPGTHFMHMRVNYI